MKENSQASIKKVKARKQLTSEFVHGEQAAIDLCARINAGYSRHYRKYHPAIYTSWNSPEQPDMYVVWYYY